MAKTIQLTPNYPALFARFESGVPHAVAHCIANLTANAEPVGEAEPSAATMRDPRARIRCLRAGNDLGALNELLACITIALQSATTDAEIEKLRVTCGAALAEVGAAYRRYSE